MKGEGVWDLTKGGEKAFWKKEVFPKAQPTRGRGGGRTGFPERP